MHESIKIFFVFLLKIGMKLIFILSVMGIFWMVMNMNDSYSSNYLPGISYEQFKLEQGLNYSGGYLFFMSGVIESQFKDKFDNNVQFVSDQLYLIKSIEDETVIVEVISE